MTNKKRHKPLDLLAAGILFALPILWLSASVVLDDAPQQKKHKDFKEAIHLKGCPDNTASPIAQQIPALKLAPEPLPVPPPYEPVPMTASIGMTGLVVYSNTNGVALINPRNHTISPIMLNEYDDTIDPETHGPIGGPLGSEGGGRFDLAMTSDGRQALISNFGDSKVFFVDLRSGKPVVSGMVKLGFFAEDIAIDPTNKWALVTDGGFSSRIATINISTRAWVPAGMDDSVDPPVPVSYTLPGGAQAQCVEIAADGRTVIVGDYWNGAAHVLLLDPATGMLSYQQTVKLWKYGTDETAAFPFLYRVLNVAISPNGRTALLANPVHSTPYPYGEDPDPAAFYEGGNVAVLKIDRPGHVVRMPDVIMPWEITGGQSIVFSPDSRRAFYETYNGQELWDFTGWWFFGQEIQVLSVTGAGQVHHTGTIHTPSWRGTSQLFGVDSMAVTPDGNFLYVTNPTLSGASPIIDIIDIRSMRHVKQIGTPTHYPDPALPGDFIEWVLPEGIAFAKTPPNERPVAVIDVDKLELILDINEVATFDGSGSSDPENSPLTFKWSLVSAPAGASPTLTPSGQTAVLTPTPNIEGTYQVGLVVNDGDLNSKMATASVVAKFYPVFPPAFALLQRLENNFIFYKEYVNKLTWTINPENKSAITAIKIYRKVKGTDDSSYALLVSLAPTASGYDDIGLTQAQLFTYRITSVNNRGTESNSVVVGN